MLGRSKQYFIDLVLRRVIEKLKYKDAEFILRKLRRIEREVLGIVLPKNDFALRTNQHKEYRELRETPYFDTLWAKD